MSDELAIEDNLDFRFEKFVLPEGVCAWTGKKQSWIDSWKSPAVSYALCDEARLLAFQGILYLKAPFYGETLLSLLQEFIRSTKEKPASLTVYFDTQDGGIFSALGLYEYIRNFLPELKLPLSLEFVGLKKIRGPALLAFLAVDKKNRKALPHTQFDFSLSKEEENFRNDSWFRIQYEQSKKQAELFNAKDPTGRPLEETKQYIEDIWETGSFPYAQPGLPKTAKEQYVQTLSEELSLPKEKIEQMLEEGLCVEGEEAKELGLVSSFVPEEGLAKKLQDLRKSLAS